MAAPGELDIEYVDARRVLLDALMAIGPQISMVEVAPSIRVGKRSNQPR